MFWSLSGCLGVHGISEAEFHPKNSWHCTSASIYLMLNVTVFLSEHIFGNTVSSNTLFVRSERTSNIKTMYSVIC